MKIMTWNIVRVYLFLLIKVLTRIRMAYELYPNTIRTQYAESTGWVAQAPCSWNGLESHKDILDKLDADIICFQGA